MQSIRTIQTVLNPVLSIELPADYQGKKVEVVVTPLEDDKPGDEIRGNLRRMGLVKQKPVLSAELRLS